MFTGEVESGSLQKPSCGSGPKVTGRPQTSDPAQPFWERPPTNETRAGEKIAGEARVGAGPPTASSQEAGTGPLGPGHWMALQAPREAGGGGTWASSSRIKTRAQLLQTGWRQNLCATKIHKTQHLVFRFR